MLVAVASEGVVAGHSELLEKGSIHVRQPPTLLASTHCSYQPHLLGCSFVSLVAAVADEGARQSTHTELLNKGSIIFASLPRTPGRSVVTGGW